MPVIETRELSKYFNNTVAVADLTLNVERGEVLSFLLGVIWFTPLYTLILGLAIGLVDRIVLRVAVRLFRRESILIRWR
jgi:ABC-type lipopolysaccharide export system ATPase subunit